MTTRITNAMLMDIMRTVTERTYEIGIKAHLVIHIPDVENIRPYVISLLAIERDFINSNFDHIEVKASFPLGTATHVIVPNRDILEATLVLDYSNLVQTDSQTTVEPIIRRYKAKLVNITNEAAAANERIFQSREEGDALGFKDLDILLIDPYKDDILHRTIATVTRRTTTANTIQGILTSVFNRIDAPEEHKVLGVELAPGADTTEHECIVIPPLEVLALPQFLQEKEYGVYPGGIGTFIQDNVCHVFSPYDTQQVTKGAPTVIILNLPPDIYPGAESTWVEYQGNYVILSTDDAAFADASDIEKSSLGSGTRYLNADGLLRKGFSVDEGIITINGKENEVVSYIESERNKFNFATPGTKHITANHMHENSQLAARNGAFSRISWENAKIDLIKPGMAVRLLTVNDEYIAEYHGVVHRVLHSIVHKTQDQFNPFMVSNAKLDVFITPDPVDNSRR